MAIFFKGSFSIVHKDIFRNEPILHVVDKPQMDVENHRGIIEYTQEKIRKESKI